MFREHGMDHKMLNKNEIQRLLKEINGALLTRYEGDELNYAGF